MTMMKMSLIPIILSLFFLTACSGGKSSATLKVQSSFSLGAGGFTGGLVAHVFGVNGATTSAAINGTSMHVMLDPGTYTFNIVGWDGTGAFQGDMYCGTTVQTISSTNASINVSVTKANCANAPFSTPLSGGVAKPLRIFSCAQLVDNSTTPQPLTSTTTTALLSNFCDDNANITTGSKETAVGIRFRVPTPPGTPNLGSGCVSTSSDPTLIGKIPLGGIPVVVDLYTSSTCPLAEVPYHYEFPTGPKNLLGPKVIVNTVDTTENYLFLYYSSAGLPLGVEVEQTLTQPDPTSTATANFKITFGRAINPTTFTTSDIVQNGTSTVTWTMTTTDNKTYNVTATPSTYGSIIPVIPANSVKDTSGIDNVHSISIDNEVRYLQSMTMSPTTNAFQQTVIGRKSESAIFTVTNTTGSTLTGCTPEIYPLSAANKFSIVTNSCASTLAPSAVCEIGVSVMTNTPGTYTGGVRLLCSTGYASSANQSLVITVTDGIKWATPTQNYDFGVLNAGMKSAPLIYHFRNESGAAKTSCSAPTVTGNFTIETDGCGSGPMPAYSSCKVKLSSSTSTAGAYTGTLSRSCDGTATSVTLNGKGISFNPDKIFIGGDTSCVVSDTNKLMCWGDGIDKKVLTSGLKPTSAYPVSVVLTGFSVDQVGISNGSVCAYDTSGYIKCWGSGFNGQLGNGSVSDSITATVIPTGLSTSTMTDITSGPEQHCVLTSGSLKCWGNLSTGILGNGNSSTISNTPVTGTSSYTNVVLGASGAMCGINGSGGVDCWGNGSTSAPSAVSGLSGVSEITGGKDFFCALTSSGSVSCWGSSTSGVVGSTTTGSSTPVSIISSGVSKLARGNGTNLEHMCAIMTSGGVQCWGRGNYGQLGTGLSASTTAVSVPGLSGVIDLAVGNDHSCAVKDVTGTRNVFCWGRNHVGQLGSGTLYDGYPVQLGNLPAGNYSQVVLGKDLTCTLRSTGQVYCWGTSGAKLGLGTTSSLKDVLVPTDLSLTGMTNLSLGSGNYIYSLCAQNSSNDAYCWGTGDHGIQGNGSLSAVYSPAYQASYSGTGFTLSAGGTFRCYQNGGNAECVGGSSSAANGSGSTSISTSLNAVSVLTANSILQMSGAYWTNFAVTTDNKLWSWGGNGTSMYSALGNGTTYQSSTAVNILNNVTKVAGFRFNACAIHDSGKLSCWGGNGYQAGVGQSSGVVNKPRRVWSLDGVTVTQVTGGESHACALDSSGRVWCWGDSTKGQVGAGHFGKELVPTPVLGFTNPVVALWKPDGDADHSCAITNDNQVWCWGNHSLFYAEAFSGPQAVSGFRP